MSHKIKIDLCEVFGVEEGQEFKVGSGSLRYKIENNKLMAKFCVSGWEETENSISWLLERHEIEILKPETPPEIKKILQAFYDMGYEWLYLGKDSLHIYAIISKNSECSDFVMFRNTVLVEWVKSLDADWELWETKSVYKIEDYI